MYVTAVGKNIRSFRISKRMTQDELAEKLFVGRQTVSNYETGRSHPDIDTLVAISKMFDTDVNALIYGIPVSPDRKKEFRITAVVTSALLLLGTAAFILNFNLQKWIRRYYASFPLILLRALLLPCFYVLLGWDFMQIISLYFGVKPLRNKETGKIHYFIIAILSAYVVVIAPHLIFGLRDFIGLYQSIKTRVDYSSQAYHFLPVWDTASMVCVQFAIKYNIAFIISGMALWATKTKKYRKAN